jgi:3-hydroxypropanoate dehydrogenase
MPTVANDHALDLIFRNARTHTVWLDKPVTDELLRQVYDLAKLGPTSANTMPMRIAFLKSKAAKERLKLSLMPGNVDKTMAAPVCAIIAFDSKFHELIPRLFPPMPAMKDAFTKPGAEQFAATHALRNSSLQGAYIIMAARALGLDCGPMSGFDNAKVDAEFFPDGRWKSNFLINIGYGNAEKLKPRFERLPFDEACKIL